MSYICFSEMAAMRRFVVMSRLRNGKGGGGEE
jgi:hypothetical protein